MDDIKSLNNCGKTPSVANVGVLKGVSADRDWPFAPDDPSKRENTKKPDMDFDPGDEHPNTMISTKKDVD